MQFFDNDQVDKMFEKFNMAAEETEFIKNSGNVYDSDINHSQLVSQMYLSKTIENAVEKMIKSNEILSKSNDRHSKKIIGLTWVLAIVGILQVIGIVAQIIIPIIFKSK